MEQREKKYSEEQIKNCLNAMNDFVDLATQISSQTSQDAVEAYCSLALYNCFRVAKELETPLNQMVEQGVKIMQESDKISIVVEDNKDGLNKLIAAMGSNYHWHNERMRAEIIEYVELSSIYAKNACEYLEEFDNMTGFDILLGRSAWCLEMIATLFGKNLQETLKNHATKQQVEKLLTE